MTGFEPSSRCLLCHGAHPHCGGSPRGLGPGVKGLGLTMFPTGALPVLHNLAGTPPRGHELVSRHARRVHSNASRPSSRCHVDTMAVRARMPQGPPARVVAPPTLCVGAVSHPSEPAVEGRWCTGHVSSLGLTCSVFPCPSPASTRSPPLQLLALPSALPHPGPARHPAPTPRWPCPALPAPCPCFAPARSQPHLPSLPQPKPNPSPNSAPSLVANNALLTWWVSCGPRCAAPT